MTGSELSEHWVMESLKKKTSQRDIGFLDDCWTEVQITDSSNVTCKVTQRRRFKEDVEETVLNFAK